MKTIIYTLGFILGWLVGAPVEDKPLPKVEVVQRQEISGVEVYYIEVEDGTLLAAISYENWEKVSEYVSEVEDLTSRLAAYSQKLEKDLKKCQDTDKTNL